MKYLQNHLNILQTELVIQMKVYCIVLFVS